MALRKLDLMHKTFGRDDVHNQRCNPLMRLSEKRKIESEEKQWINI